ncbi:MAG TPA: hypothetical protein VGT99_06165, partial [Gammaproteobacteria bacterium]|nr:hypothetical protein [Gammaproteobacteria bacterium]
AQADLMLGVVSQALVGVVEEATLPLAQHRQRQGVPADTPVAEGSHWLLLEQDAVAGKPLRFLRFEGRAEREAYIDAHCTPSDYLYWTLNTDIPWVATAAQRFPLDSDTQSGVHDSQQAAWVTAFLTGGMSGSLFVSDNVLSGSYTLLHLGP